MRNALLRSFAVRVKGLGICLLITFASAVIGLGQAQITTGTIQGTVEDANGAALPGASVEIKNLGTNATTDITTNEDGRFVALQLSPGRYTVSVSKQGFATSVLENVELTVGQAINLPVSMKVSQVEERVTITAPTVDTVKTESSTTLNETTVNNTPILGRKFEDLLTLTPGVSIVQGPDGDEINFVGQRGIFNNVSLDGGDYNNGFFGEQVGGQRAAIDIPLDAVKEFQVVATGASAEFGRTAGGIINVITKSGENEVHGSVFHFQRLEALTANTSDGKSLTDFHREQFGGNIGGPIKKDKAFFFFANENIRENLTRANLSETTGSTACPVTAPTIVANEGLIRSNTDCQRLALLNFFKTSLNQDDGQPVKRPIKNSAFLAKLDWNLSSSHKLALSYNFDYSKNDNQTFDVATYGNSANGTEGPSKINVLNFNLFSTLSPTKVNEAHFTYSREVRPRATTESNVPPDTGIGGLSIMNPGPSFRFGNPYFLQPTVDELLWRTQIRDTVSIITGNHTVKFGGEWLHSLNDQIFRGFFNGRYLFDSVAGFLRYVSPASLGIGFGPTVAECSDGTFGDILVGPSSCGSGDFAPSNPFSFGPGPLIGFIGRAGRNGAAMDQDGASTFDNEDYGLFIQDKWQARTNLTLNFGLRWEAQILPEPFVPPDQTAYGIFLNDPNFPSDGTLPSQKKEFQPRIGFAWDMFNNSRSVLRGSYGIYYARQNMLTQVSSLTTNGVQLQAPFNNTAIIGFGAPAPIYPGVIIPPPLPAGQFNDNSGIAAFARDYENPRIYTTNVAFEQEVLPDATVYFDFTHAKGVHLTRFIELNQFGGPPVVLPVNGNRVIYTGPAPFGPRLLSALITFSNGKSLYRGFTAGFKKRFSKGFQTEANYVLAKDLDDDSNERDPFTDRAFNRFDLSKDYSLSDRDVRHRFNFYIYSELPGNFDLGARIQARSAQPITTVENQPASGAPCSPTNSNTRVVNGVDCGRNHLRKDNKYFSFDWRLQRPFKFGERYAIVPVLEMFNSFNNKNNVNPLSTPPLTNFDGFLRLGVGDPRQLQLAVKFTF